MSCEILRSTTYSHHHSYLTCSCAHKQTWTTVTTIHQARFNVTDISSTTRQRQSLRANLHQGRQDSGQHVSLLTWSQEPSPSSPSWQSPPSFRHHPQSRCPCLRQTLSPAAGCPHQHHQQHRRYPSPHHCAAHLRSRHLPATLMQLCHHPNRIADGYVVVATCHSCHSHSCYYFASHTVRNNARLTAAAAAVAVELSNSLAAAAAAAFLSGLAAGLLFFFL